MTISIKVQQVSKNIKKIPDRYIYDALIGDDLTKEKISNYFNYLDLAGEIDWDSYYMHKLYTRMNNSRIRKTYYVVAEYTLEDQLIFWEYSIFQYNMLHGSDNEKYKS